MADVFISYARKDKDFVKRLHEALAGRKLDTWVDWEDIPPTADFMQEIRAAIEGADAVVVVLSPEWGASKVCRVEATHAFQRGKRLIPVVCREVAPGEILPEVAALNWIFFRAGDEFDAAFELLTSAITTDLARVRALTRLLVRAVEWDAEQRDASFVLRGSDLAAAEATLTRAADGEKPQPTPLQREYVLASRIDAVRRQRRTVAFLATGLVVAIGLAAVAYWQYGVAEVRRVGEREARLEAEQRTRVANAQRLAAQADAALDRFPQRSLLLAVEAVRVTLREGEGVVVDAEQSLRRALASVGGRGAGGRGTPVLSVALSPDGRRVALSRGKAVQLWDLDGASAPATLGEIDVGVTEVAFAGDGRRLVAAGRGACVFVLDAAPPVAKRFSSPKSPETALGAILSRDGRRLVAVAADGSAVLWDLTAADPTSSPSVLPPGSFPESGLGLSLGATVVVATADGRWVAVKSSTQAASLWDLRAGQAAGQPRTLEGSDGLFLEMTISPDGRYLIEAGADHAVRLWDLTLPDPSVPAHVLRGHVDGLTASAFSADGRWLVTGSFDRTARVWDLRAADPEAASVVLRGHGDMVRAVSVGADGRWVLTSALVNHLDVNGTHDTSAWLWDLRRPDAASRPFELKGHEVGVSAATLTPDGHWAITGSERGRVRLWDLGSEDPSASPVVLRGHENGIHALHVSADGRRLVTHDMGAGVRAWDLHAVQPSASPLVLRSGSASGTLQVSPDSRWLVSASFMAAGRIWDLAAANPAMTATAWPSLTRSDSLGMQPGAFSADSRWFVTGGEYAPEHLLDLTAGDVQAGATELRGPGGAVKTLTFSPDGRWLVMRRDYAREKAFLWDIRRGADADPFALAHAAPIGHVAVSPDSRRVVTGSDDGAARLWNLAADDPTRTPVVLAGHAKRIGVCRFSPDGRRLVTASDEGVVQMWDLGAGAPTATLLRGPAGRVIGVDFSPDGRWLVTRHDRDYAEPDGAPAIRLWDLAAAHPETTGRVLLAHEGVVAFSGDGRWLLIDGDKLWDLHRRDPSEKQFTLKGHKDGVGFTAISADSRWLATAGANYATEWRDDVVRLWDLSADDPSLAPRVLLGHERGVTALAISPDGGRLVTAGVDATVRLWDLRAPDPAEASVLLAGHRRPIRHLAVTPDGRLALSSSEDGEIRLWPLRVEDLIARARDAAGRNLDLVEWALFFPGLAYRRTFPDLAAPELCDEERR